MNLEEQIKELKILAYDKSMIYGELIEKAQNIEKELQEITKQISELELTSKSLDEKKD
jgi:DNA-binding protein YbaB